MCSETEKAYGELYQKEPFQSSEVRSPRFPEDESEEDDVNVVLDEDTERGIEPVAELVDVVEEEIEEDRQGRSDGKPL